MVNMLQPNMPALAPTKDKGDFIIHQDGPINAEPAKEQLAESWRTPASLSYMRNHGDVLHLAREGYELVIDVEEGLRSALQTGASFANKTSLGLKQILETGRQELDASLQCAGNRRNELNERAEVEGIQWSAGTVLNAKWSGVLLRDFLIRLGLPDDSTSSPQLKNAHVHFVSHQPCEQADRYEASILLEDAMDPSRCVMLADTMNNKPLPDEHGGPLRVIVPGFIGARSVKWLQELRISTQPSTNFYMTSDYKKLPEDVGSEDKEQAMSDNPPLQETGLQSSITKVEQVDTGLSIQGYALDGRGERIASVQVCLLRDESGQTPLNTLVEQSLETGEWCDASLQQESKAEGEKVWSWTLFNAHLPIKEEWKGKQIAALCRAKTQTGHEQETLTEWNIRGVANQGYGVQRNIQC